jgi:hypothetical protein
MVSRPREELVEWERINEFKAYLGADRGARSWWIVIAGM